MHGCRFQNLIRTVNTMDDTMSKEKAADLLDNLVGMVSDTQGNDYDTALRMGADALNAERHGKWLHKNSTFKNHWLCSECGYTWYFDTKEASYCPHCGALMDEVT